MKSPAMATIAMAAAVFLVAAMSSGIGEAQSSSSGVATCGESLIPCESYLNATKPPSSCCTPLDNALKTQKTCLCSILNDQSVLSGLGINVTEARTLPTRCGISTAESNICASAPAASPTSTATTPPPPPPPPPPPGSAAWRITGAGVSVLIILWMASLNLVY